MDNGLTLFIAVAGLMLMFFVFMLAFAGVWLIRPWMRGFASGGQVSLMNIVGMRLRGTPPMLIIDAYVMLLQSGGKVRVSDVERAYIMNRSRIMVPEDLVECVRNQKATSEKEFA